MKRNLRPLSLELSFLDRKVIASFEYEQPEYETGYVGGWFIVSVYYKDRNITNLLSKNSLETIQENGINFLD